MKQESNRQKTMEDIDGGLHPAVDGQSLDSDSNSQTGFAGVSSRQHIPES